MIQTRRELRKLWDRLLSDVDRGVNISVERKQKFRSLANSWST